VSYDRAGGVLHPGDFRQEASRLDARRGVGARAPGLAHRGRGDRGDL